MTDPIKARIQELCPDVMELKFGCLVNFSTFTGLERRAGTGCILYHFEDTNGVVLYTHGKSSLIITREEIEEIIGSPITLAVVLRAMRQTTFAGIVDDMGDIYNQDDQYSEPVATWNLEHDYDQQSEEFKQFIGNLLGV